MSPNVSKKRLIFAFTLSCLNQISSLSKPLYYFSLHFLSVSLVSFPLTSEDSACIFFSLLNFLIVSFSKIFYPFASALLFQVVSFRKESMLRYRDLGGLKAAWIQILILLPCKRTCKNLPSVELTENT